MNVDSLKGDKVRFTGENVGVYTEKEALKILKVGQVYEVEAVISSSFFVYVKLKGFKEKFASAMFENVL